MFESNTEITITDKEIFDTYSKAVEMLMDIFDFSEIKLAALIQESVNLFPYDRDKLLSFIESICSKVEQVTFSAWHKTRQILYHHRSHPEASWALSERELSRYEKLYEILQPTQTVEKIVWMFNEHWPNFPQGHKYKTDSHDEQEKFILEKRIQGLKAIYKEHGLSKIIELGKDVKEVRILGDVLSYII